MSRVARSYALAAVTLWCTACGDDSTPDSGPKDAGDTSPTDSGTPAPRDAAADSAAHDAAQSDAARPDAAAQSDAGTAPDIDASGGPGPSEAGVIDSNDASVDTGVAEAAVAEAAVPDTGVADTGVADAGAADAGQTGTAPDAGTDSGRADAGASDASTADAGGATHDAGLVEPTFTKRVVTSGLSGPWEITWGPDGRLWISERSGKRILRVNPANGSRSTALTLADAYQASGQDGVLGLALHPRLLKDEDLDYVYVAYTYDADAGNDVDRRAKIVRFRYDSQNETLGSPLELISGLSASVEHNSGRLVFGPDNRLYYTLGDQGHNQFDNTCLPVHAQDLPTQSDVDGENWAQYQGKVLRIALDGSIPSDNPVLAGVRSHVYTYGHRNAQGIVFGPDGKLYASEQGPKTDDEVNLIVAGKNYGWPHVAGFRDDKAYVYGNWSAASPEPCSSFSYSDYDIPSAVPLQRESEWSHPDFVPPLKTFYTVDNGFDFTDPACAGNEFICWPTIAPSSIDLYRSGQSGVPTWGNSLLVTSLKEGTVFRLRLSDDGLTTVGEPSPLFKTTNRYRDLAIAPDRRTFYVVTDSDGATSGPSTGSTVNLENRGAILEFRTND
jgi:PQQ-dependent dehydrogenase (s-GDH family)